MFFYVYVGEGKNQYILHVCIAQANMRQLYGCYMIIKDEYELEDFLDFTRLETQKYPSTVCSDIPVYPSYLTIRENILTLKNNDSGSAWLHIPLI
jgi:hypothetical protein